MAAVNESYSLSECPMFDSLNAHFSSGFWCNHDEILLKQELQDAERAYGRFGNQSVYRSDDSSFDSWQAV